MPNIQTAYEWAIETCGRENVGYSQAYRNERTVNGITYYDCSSFIWYSLIAGGWDMVTANNGETWPFTTSSMRQVLLKLGFKQHDANEDWKKGDILWRQGHTEMAFSNVRTMGAHTANAPLSEQVSINANPSNKASYTLLYRWENGAVTDWIKGNRYLSTGEQQNNATLVYAYLLDKGWTVNAIAGLLGNMQQESTICPDLDERGGSGYGLVQWTPKTNYTNWANANGYDITDGNYQLQWINEETIKQGQWIETSAYPISFDEFKVSLESPEYLATCFEKNFERPATSHPERQGYARWWLDWYNGSYVPPTNPPQTGDTSFEKSMPIWMYLGRRKNDTI